MPFDIVLTARHEVKELYMRVGIITLNGTGNYGNVLQNYAVQTILRDLGAEAETIRNVTEYQNVASADEMREPVTVSRIKDALISRLMYKYGFKNSGGSLTKSVWIRLTQKGRIRESKQRREAAFKNFAERYIRWADDTYDFYRPWSKEQTDRYDYYITGSDQVWNPANPSAYMVGFLQFAPTEKRIALSPSFGVGEIPGYLRESYARWIRDIPYLSVRENRGREIIQDLCDREAKVLCDPTIAVSIETWLEMERRPPFLDEEKYILTYFLGNRTKSYERYIDRIAETYNLRIIHLFDLMQLEAYVVSPEEFIYLIHHAELVCTDSFHGVVFSIIMERDFVSFPRVEPGDMSSRMDTLLSIFHVENRYFPNIKETELFSTNFLEAGQIRAEKRQELMDFLREALAKKQ